MADYRLSAQVIKRSNGRSAVAAAAYRAAMRLDDERTGEIHNYERKRGVVHAEILAPENTPSWMFERQKLWNAVETVEKRKDAQLAREIQLSIPHELEPAQRLELVRGFVHEQFVSRGMVADVAIHQPDKQSDSRNHHAHVMLTMRDLTADGFGKKNRDWNSPESLQNWREQWAHHQNRSLERNGHDTRVDHRSYAERGIDQEPTHHRGKMADQMEKNGRRSRIGDDNREVESRNARRARDVATHAQMQAYIAREVSRIDAKARRTFEDAENHHIKTLEDLRARQFAERQDLERTLATQNDELRQSITAQLERVSNRLGKATGFKKTVRDFLGLSQHDEKTRDQLGQSLNALSDAEATRRHTLEDRQRDEQRQLKDHQAERLRLVKEQAEAERQREKRDKGVDAVQTSAQPANDFRQSADAPAPDSAPERPRRPWESGHGRDGDDQRSRRPWESGLSKGRDR